jgi:serine/threonine protein kinase
MENVNPIREAFEAILPPEERAHRLKGRELNGYILGDVLDDGEGGFGIVYEATHLTMDSMSKWAVKVLAVDVEADPEAYARFEREVGVLVKMDKVKNVVNIKHAGQVDGLPWFAMEFIEGKPLSKWLAGRKITTKQLVGVLKQILAGLADAQEKFKHTKDATICPSEEGHNGGDPGPSPQTGLTRDPQHFLPQFLVHRDIKPANIMVKEAARADGVPEVTIIDFGISVLFEHNKPQAGMTATTLGTMTREYASPEMLADPGRVDIRSDVFQVGLLAFEMMTNERYWDYWQTATKKLQESQWPKRLRRAVAGSLAWERDHRYYGPDEFLRELTHPTLHELPRWLKRNTWKMVSVILAMALAVAAYFYVPFEYKTIVAEKQARELKDKLEDRTKDLTKETDQKERLSVSNHELNNQLDEKGKTIVAVRATTQSIHESIDVLQRQNKALDKDNDNLRTSRVELDNQLRKVKEENSQLGVEKTALTATTQATQLRIAALGKDNETVLVQPELGAGPVRLRY